MVAWALQSGVQVVQTGKFWIDGVDRTNILNVGYERKSREQAKGFGLDTWKDSWYFMGSGGDEGRGTFVG